MSLPYASKAASISAKIPRKYPADRCKVVFAERIFVKASKNAHQILAYLQVVLRSIGGNKPAKTDAGSTPKCLRQEAIDEQMRVEKK